ncbi:MULTISPECIES: replicative DNA helicase [unclassified Mesorhizobium]|uniref:replicative DNA helicase n=2 Tax=Mesorhizobium TaxID=68287 RepID=UPI000F7657A3|nr:MULTISPECIES: replicative DNA helicase [unclassified Mesorhizobium]RUW98329.1 replicative DNA helicase [Mesorhizobium sp. M8A.F.Ca.ET.059.01.1.1]TGR58713.1 replicative DNA helicase [bacterium M00.F.Ca.ET.199.01.1.1]TGU41177.1 replicative DNA helicase [bacterium M00.F.Ca.ET.156.01.1.1]TGU91914.1 replicative DNA helicase [Mesorhizobium sp. M00.F.Ca.ET.151.01.1.1]TGV10530.1 replicative DNA helicase [Mesorhizobium sp. M8A.F.Ca.ET.173.01.1.1]TGV53667.1 replicative DNA helicase [bacterium M00.F.
MAEAARKFGVAEQPLYRESPNNIEAEQALLGAILVNNDAFYRVSDFLKSGHFHEPLHRKIFDVAAELIRMGKAATPITLKTFLPADEKVGDMTVAQYVVRLAVEAVTVVNATDYGRAIYDLATRRALITVGEDMVNIAYDAPVDMSPSEQIEDAERRLFELAETGRYDGGFESFTDAVKTAVDMANAAYMRDGGLSGLATGMRDLDRRMGGLQPSDLIVLAGRPGMGKTSLATNIAFNVAEAYVPAQQADGSFKAANGGVVGFFSLEMSSEQLATRIISEQTEISSSKIRRGEISEMDFEKLVACSQTMQKIPLFIDQTGGISIAQLSARARRLKRQRGLDLIVIDYIQLMQGSSAKSSQNRVQEITEITTGLKALAKELTVPIIALSQLSRQVESRDDKRPQLSDLRESGSIEQDADVVIFVYREEYYLKNREPKLGTEEYVKWENEMNEMRGKAEVIVAKQRHGPTGTVTLAFHGEFTRFSDLAEEHHIAERFE